MIGEFQYCVIITLTSMLTSPFVACQCFLIACHNQNKEVTWAFAKLWPCASTDANEKEMSNRL